MLAYLRKGETFDGAGGRVRDRQDHGLAVRERDRRTARGPRAEAPAGGPGREKGRSRLRDPRRDADPDRPGRRDQPFYSGKHKKHGMNLQVIAVPARRHPVGVRRAARLGPRQESRMDLGRARRAGEARAWSPSRTRDTRAAPGRRSRTRARTSPSRRKRPTAPTRNSAPPANGRTRSSRHGRSSRKLRCCPWRAGKLAKAIHVLQLHEA